MYHFVMEVHAKSAKLGDFDEDKFEDMQGKLYEVSDEKVSRYDLIEFIWNMNYIEPSEEEQNREMLKAGKEEMTQ